MIEALGYMYIFISTSININFNFQSFIYLIVTEKDLKENLEMYFKL